VLTVSILTVLQLPGRQAASVAQAR
jgi:hypothetical protein